MTKIFIPILLYKCIIKKVGIIRDSAKGRPLYHIRAEGVCRQHHVEVAAAYLDIDHVLFGGEVARCDDMLARSVAEHNDGSAAKLATGIGDHLRAGLHEMAEVLVGVVLGGVAQAASVAVDLYEGVLPPAPG